MDPDDMAAFLESWDQAERDAVAILQDALPEQRGAEPDPSALHAAADRLRAALAAGDPDAVWMRRAAGLREDLNWGFNGAMIHDEDLLLGCVGATVGSDEDPGLPDEAQASIMSLELVDWLGAIIGAVRAGPGSDAAAPALVAHIGAWTEIEDGPLDEGDAEALEHAFELLLPAWEAAGVVDLDQCLTELGMWLLPRAAARVWHASFDDDLEDVGEEADETDVLHAEIDALSQRFAAWCGHHGVDADPDWVATLLHLRVDELDDRPTRWTLSDLSEVLLEIAPRKLSVPGSEIRTAMDALAAFVRYLEAEGELADGSAGVGELTAWLERSGDLAATAMDDPSRWGPAKTLFSAAADEGVDPEDVDAVRAWMDDFNERPDAERRALLGGFGPAAGLAPRLLPPDQQLAELVRATPIWRQIIGLLTYVRDRLPLTAAGNLKLADARRLVAELDTGDTFDPTFAGGQQKTRSSADLAGLTRVFDLANELGIVEQHGSALIRVSARAAEVESDPVAAWPQIITRCLTDGILGQSPRHFSPWWIAELDTGVIDLLIGLEQAEGEIVPVEAIANVLLELPLSDGREVDPFLTVWITRDVHRFLVRLAVLGLVAIPGPGRDHRDLDTDLTGAGVRVTPLGTLLLHRVAGLPAHRIGELADGSARDLLDGLAELPDEAADAEVAAWSAQRPLAAVLEEVTDAARGDRVRAVSALLVYDHLGAEVAAAAVEQLADDEAAGTLARAWLVLEGVRPFEDAAGQDGRDAMIDVLAALIELGGPAAVNEALQLLGNTDDQLRFLEAAWRSPSPDTLTVLSAVGDLHPDKTVRKAGRKAAFKRRSAT